MSPDIEWHIGEESDRETIVKTTQRRPPRWRKPIVIIAAILGIGLGIAYAAIPEPPQPPAPAPTVPSPASTPQLPSLDEAIRRDAYALTANTGEVYPTTFFTTAPSSAMEEYADWYSALQSIDVHWNPIGSRSMYTVFETGTLPDGTAWVKMGQFRNDDFFRQIRFYRLQDNRWVWTLPDWSFWSGTVETHTFSSGVLFSALTFSFLAYSNKSHPIAKPANEAISTISRGLAKPSFRSFLSFGCIDWMLLDW